MRVANPIVPPGVNPPAVAWADANCDVDEHDYGNGNIERVYTCEQWGSGGRKYRCTWRSWNGAALVLQHCNEITRAHYHDSHGGGEGPQSYGVMPPYIPMGQQLQLRARLWRNPARARAHRWTHGLGRAHR